MILILTFKPDDFYWSETEKKFPHSTLLLFCLLLSKYAIYHICVTFIQSKIFSVFVIVLLTFIEVRHGRSTGGHQGPKTEKKAAKSHLLINFDLGLVE